MKKRKPRGQFIYIGSDKPFNQVSTSTDSIILPDDGNLYHIFHQREYDRTKKPKVIYALFQFFGSRSIARDPLRELEKYDRIYAIDTNYKRVAVTTAMAAVRLPGSDHLTLKHLYTESFSPISSQPEREAWKSFIERYNNDAKEINCLIVDSELGSLARINKREEAIIGDFNLPSNWQLNYATSDTNDGFIMVRLLRACDKLSREYLRKRQRRRHGAKGRR